tara:strand:- start:3518 stop:3958 length:441 start_codon:yes stop_codon:yes gene_type:complete
VAISSARFLEYLCHKWDNLQQAQQWPNQFAHVHYDWWVEGAHLHSRQWYDWNGHVYRERTHRLDIQDDHIKLNINESGLHLIFKLDETGHGFIGKVPPNTYNENGILIETTITLDSATYTSFDKGTDKDGNILWGKIPGPFVFKHT